MMQNRTAVDLSNCDREPIHIPGSIQPHGCLLACDKDLRSILRHSANAKEFLNIDDISLVGRDLESVIGDAAVHTLRNELARNNNPSRPALHIGLRCGNAGLFDAAIHNHAGTVIIEFERSADDGADNTLTTARSLFSRLDQRSDTATVLRSVPPLLRALVAYDRVMVYRFTEDGSGQVIAERKAAHLESFLGQFFPASDIPKQARELYLKNSLRIISDAANIRIPIEPQVDTSGEPLDLSFAHLRSVSPIHCEYLRNMGVQASMSISIIVEGKLWGLVACHNYTPKVVPMPQRIALEMFGDLLSLTLQASLQKDRFASLLKARAILDDVLREAADDNDGGVLRGRLETFRDLVPCDGVGLWLGGVWTSIGLAPPKNAIPSIVRLAGLAATARIWATHELSKHLDGAEAYSATASGVLAVPLSQLSKDYLFFFRKEVVHTVEWAGDPNKTYDTGPLGDRLTPRKSFAIWKEIVERQSIPWSSEERDIAEATRIAVQEVIMRQSELLSDERRKADVRQKILNDELNHRVKNILALIKSIVSHSTSDKTLEDYVAGLKGRIMAIAFAHDQIVRHDGGGSLKKLLEAELSPYREGPAGITLQGPDIDLDSRAYSVMALVLHELATNAAKYGALSAATGAITVTWIIDRNQDCELTWVESGGPNVRAPARRGFGSVLVDRSVPFDLGGRSELQFQPSGVVARFVIPSKFVSQARSQAASQAAIANDATSDAKPLIEADVLLVEDQLMIAMDAEQMLADLGAKSVTSAATASEALRALAEKSPTVAVLDINLGNGTSIPVAEELVKRSVPFVFATGYGDTAMIPPDLSSVNVVRKPYDIGQLAAALSSIVKRPD